MRLVIELGSLRSPGTWARTDVRRLAVRQRWIVLGGAVVCLAVAFAISYAIYRHFGAPRNEYDLNIYFHALNEWRGGSGLYSYAQ